MSNVRGGEKKKKLFCFFCFFYFTESRNSIQWFQSDPYVMLNVIVLVRFFLKRQTSRDIVVTDLLPWIVLPRPINVSDVLLLLKVRKTTI